MNKAVDNQQVIDARATLTGIAHHLVEGMESDNCCSFFVSEAQARELNELCATPEVACSDRITISTMSSGEHTAQEELLNTAGLVYGDDVGAKFKRIHALLNEIFDGEDAP